MPGEQGGGAGEGRQIPGRAVQPERRGETALPDGPAIKGRNTPARLPPRFPAPGKCTSHLGFGLVWNPRPKPSDRRRSDARSVMISGRPPRLSPPDRGRPSARRAVASFGFPTARRNDKFDTRQARTANNSWLEVTRSRSQRPTGESDLTTPPADPGRPAPVAAAPPDPSLPAGSIAPRWKRDHSGRRPLPCPCVPALRIPHQSRARRNLKRVFPANLAVRSPRRARDRYTHW